MKEEKLTEEEKLTNQLKNFTIEEIESYLELLLTKSIEAIEKEDLSTYGSIEKTLNSSLIIFSSKVRNFYIIYNRIKLKVANKFLKKYLNNNITILDEVGTAAAFLTVEEAEKITEAEEYIKYKTAKTNVINSFKPSILFFNDRYTINSTDSYYYTIIDKESKYHSEIEVEGSSEILKAFVTKDSAILTDIEKQLLNHETTPEEIAKAENLLKKQTSTIGLEEHISFKKKFENYIEDTIYYNENEVFIVFVTKYGTFEIFHKRTGSSVTIYTSSESWFSMDFINFCMGKTGSLINEMQDPSINNE